MKKVASLIVALLVLAIVIVEQIFVDNTLDILLEKIENLDGIIVTTEKIDNENISQLIIDLDDFWTEKEKIMCLTINHNDLNRVGEQIKKVKVYISQDNKDDCIYEMKILKFYAESYQHVMEMNPQNLL